MAPKSSYKDLSIDISHVLRQSVLAEISGRSPDNHYSTVYQIADILETTTIDALLLGIREALFIPLRMSLKQH